MVRQWLVEIRGNRTHDQMAALAGLSRSMYTRIENGESLSVKAAKRLGDAVGVSWIRFFSSEGDENAHSGDIEALKDNESTSTESA